MAAVTVQTEPDHAFTVTMRAGQHELVGDEPLADGGDDLGPSPHEFLLASLGSCTAMTLQLYARRKAWPLSGVRIELAFNRHDEPVPEGGRRRVETITRQIALSGPLTQEQRERLLQIAGRCPVQRTLMTPPTIVDELVAALDSDSTSGGG